MGRHKMESECDYLKKIDVFMISIKMHVVPLGAEFYKNFFKYCLKEFIRGAVKKGLILFEYQKL